VQDRKICEKTCEWCDSRTGVIVSECVRCDDCERLCWTEEVPALDHHQEAGQGGYGVSRRCKPD
jgi:hypothetical protein